jgi:hypothetical protein
MEAGPEPAHLRRASAGEEAIAFKPRESIPELEVAEAELVAEGDAREGTLAPLRGARGGLGRWAAR